MRSLIYKRASGRDIALDVYPPAAGRQAALVPVVVWIHGGALISGPRSASPSAAHRPPQLALNASATLLPACWNSAEAR